MSRGRLTFARLVKMVERTCCECRDTFLALVGEVNRGNAKFCSRKCSRTYHNKYKKQPVANTECALCGTQFYRKPSRKSKSGLFFCCRQHKDEAQRLSGLVEIHPAHYGTGYRRLALANLDQVCNRCGFNSESRILEVHHIDRNRDNNSIENLEMLCPNCHSIEHLI